MTAGSPFREVGHHYAISLPGAEAVFTTRQGGRSSGPYESLNLGLLTDDDLDRVVANRADLAKGLGVRFAVGHQVHAAHVARVSEPTAIEISPDGGVSGFDEADGQATATPGVAPMVLTADCLPVAVAGGGAVAMLHAGWRGLAAGVLAEGVRAVRELGAGGPLEAAIGPGVGLCCYEVGDEVRSAFADLAPEVSAGRHLDLKAIAAHQLRSLGVERVHDLGMCTICSEPSLFYSHRRDHGATGRQAGIAWLT